MKLLYISGSYVPSRRASSIHVMQMCQAMSHQGHEVTLVTKNIPDRLEQGVDDDFAFYGVSPSFAIKKIRRPSWTGGGLVFYWLVNSLIKRNRESLDLVYVREDPLVALLGVRHDVPVIFEAHGLPQGQYSEWGHNKLFQSGLMRRLIVISTCLKQDFIENGFKIDEKKIMVAHDGANPIERDSPYDWPKEDILENHPCQIGYVGQLYPGKGMEIICQLATQLPDCDFQVVGGNENDIRKWKSICQPENIYFHGFVKPSLLKEHYDRFDILLLPAQDKVFGASQRLNISNWMSPLKLFEYMSTGKPIISSDLPVLKEVLEHEKNALLIEPENVEGWKTAVVRLKNDISLATRLGKQAKIDFLQEYTWSARAEKVLRDL